MGFFDKFKTVVEKERKIVELKLQVPTLQQIIQMQGDKSMELREARIAGETVSDAEIKSADEKKLSAELDLKAVTDSIEKLKAQAVELKRVERENRIVKIQDHINAFPAKSAKIEEDLLRASALYTALYVFLHGGHIDGSVPHIFWTNERAISFTNAVRENLKSIEKKFGRSMPDLQADIAYLTGPVTSSPEQEIEDDLRKLCEEGKK